MNSSFTDRSHRQPPEEDVKSDSTIQLEFGDSTVQIQTSTCDSNRNSYPSSQGYYLRKRSASRESDRTPTKKHRNKSKQLVFSENAQHEPSISASESQCTPTYPKQQHLHSKANPSNDSEHRLDWLKDFMRESLDTIRDIVVQACLTALSTQSSIPPLNSNRTTQNMNVNNHLTRLVRSEHSLVSPKTTGSWRQHRLRSSSIVRRRNDRTLLGTQLDVNEDDEEDDLGKKQRVHHRARASPYPVYRNIVRTPVSDLRVPWSYEWLQYKPTIFTAEEIYINPGADPDLLKSSSTSIALHFNAIDGGIDRRSVYHRYPVREYDGLPLNPIGRTGLQGRGVLLRWGPNTYQYVIICRWKRDIHGRVLLHPSNGKQVLEVLLEMQADAYNTQDFILTGGLRMIGNGFPPQLQDRLRRFVAHTETIFNNRKKTSSSLSALDYLFEQNPISWKGAYFDDARNTDNAWIELSIEYLLDHDHQLTSCIPSLHMEQLNRLEQPRFVWQDVRRTIDIGPRTHYRLIRNLASKLDAYF